MRIFLALIILAMTFTAKAQNNLNVVYSFVNGLGQVQTVKQVSFTPMSIGIYSNAIVVGEEVTAIVTDSTLTNPMIAGFTYRVKYFSSIQPPTISTVFTNYFPTNIADGSVIFAKNFVAISTNLGNGIYALTRAQADASYAPLGSGGTNIDNANGTNLTLTGNVTATGGNVVTNGAFSTLLYSPVLFQAGSTSPMVTGAPNSPAELDFRSFSTSPFLNATGAVTFTRSTRVFNFSDPIIADGSMLTNLPSSGVTLATNWTPVRYSSTVTNQYYFSNAPNSAYSGTYVFKAAVATNSVTVLIYTNGTKGLVYSPIDAEWIIQSVTTYDPSSTTWVYDNSINTPVTEVIGGNWEDNQAGDQVNIGARMFGSTTSTPLTMPSGDGAMMTNLNLNGSLYGDGSGISNTIASSSTFIVGMPKVGTILQARAAINRAVSGQVGCYIFFSGDSTTAGKGGGNQQHTNSLINSFQYDLCKLSPWVNGDGWIGGHAGQSTNYLTYQDPRILNFGDFVISGSASPMSPSGYLLSNTGTNPFVFKTTCVADNVLMIVGFAGGTGNFFVATNGVVAVVTNSSIAGTYPNFGVLTVPLPSNTNSVNISIWKTNAASSLTLAGMIPNLASNSINTINCGSEGAQAAGVLLGIASGTNLMQKLGFTNCINIVSIGLNDVANNQFSNTLNAIWTNLIPFNTSVIQMSMTPAVNGGSGNYSTNVAWIQSISTKLSLPFIDPWTYFYQNTNYAASPFSYDGLHMNQAGYYEVSKLILDSLKIPTYKKP